MKYLKWVSLYVGLTFSISSCYNTKNVAYFQDLTDTSKVYSQVIKSNYELHIQPDDVIEIIVNSINPGATAVFNLGNASAAAGLQLVPSNTNALITTDNHGSSFRGYMVDKDGGIDFPVLGKLTIEGFTLSRLKDTLERKLTQYLQHPIVNARILNYKITVLGEVRNPSAYSLPSQRITVVDALGMAGDLTIYGKRENVLLIREENGERKFVRLNLNASSVFESPYYYLKQNDIVYVEPNKAKTVASDSTTLKTISIFTSIMTVLIVLISRL